MRPVVKQALKRSARLLGFEVRRIADRNSGSPVKATNSPASEDPHDFLWVRNHGIRTVLDIGANTGQFALAISEVLPESKIYCFEPLTDCYQQLVKNMQHVSGFRAFNCALGEESARKEFHRNEFSLCSSLLMVNDLHKHLFPFALHTQAEQVRVRPLDDVFKDEELDDNILVKIDVQGYEDKVLLGGVKTVARAKAIIIETTFQSLYDGQCLFDRIYKFLTDLGFTYSGNAWQLKNQIDNSVLQADSIFLKP